MTISVSGSVITFSDATTQSTAAAAGGVSSLNGQTGAVVTTTLGNIGSSQRLTMYSGTNLFPSSTISGSSLYYATGSSGAQGGGATWTSGSSSSNPNSVTTCLYYNTTGVVNRGNPGNTGFQPPAGNVAAVSGTWRLLDLFCPAGTSTYFNCCGNNQTQSYMYSAIFVRVS
jgi:hypothetical protein